VLARAWISPIGADSPGTSSWRGLIPPCFFNLKFTLACERASVQGPRGRTSILQAYQLESASRLATPWFHRQLISHTFGGVGNKSLTYTPIARSTFSRQLCADEKFGPGNVATKNMQTHDVALFDGPATVQLELRRSAPNRMCTIAVHLSTARDLEKVTCRHVKRVHFHSSSIAVLPKETDHLRRRLISPEEAL
jgi:hypothetical protein